MLSEATQQKVNLVFIKTGSCSVNKSYKLTSQIKEIYGVEDKVKVSELIDKEVFAEGLRVGRIKDVHVDGEEWKVTHFEIELTKDAAKELLGVRTSFRNVLAISAVGPASKSITTESGIDLQVSKGQLRIYLRPP
jgi:sporulation protein YlmC with PRC-barrel domain